MAEGKGEGQDHDGLRASQGLAEPIVTANDKGEKLNTKFMQTLDRGVYQELKALATERRVTVQEFLRAVVVPEYLLANRKSNRRT